ncbi:NAD-dependent epimerase/dehydratase family protein [Paraburkholderia unamae]|uniref:UDP-glucose 4-epimerase n=1 Tax=Paraburkholderia unamae TaxID=219649 RepID=A0ABX5KKC1_9BURK|nr:NAD-dependent epimerase/dehydratase family protein [Paraburkholderia unamae]PVX82310.1 UDP-glucose 4-epimerase [Paraburkholderia unamae]
MIQAVSGAKVLVLGGFGFLGRHLVDGLLHSGANVRVFERNMPNDAQFARDVEVVLGNFVTGEGFDEALRDVDVVYHLISTTVPSTSNDDPIADVQSNLIGTLQLLRHMQAANVGRIVYVSSGGTVYGNPMTLPVPEGHPLNPLCSYGVVKVAVENYLAMYSKLYGLSATVLRVANPYGMHQHRIGVQGVIPTFIGKMMRGEPIEIWGDGSVVRDYIYVEDVVSALLAAYGDRSSGTFNIGSGVGHRISDVLKVVRQTTGLEGAVRYLPQRNFDVEQIYLDIRRAREGLNWKPKYSLESGCAHYWRLIKAKGDI